MNLTQHSKDRGKERLGLNVKAFEKLSQRAFERGYGEKDFKNSQIQKYLAKLFLGSLSGMRCGAIRVYGEHVYLFTKKGTLKTVFSIPLGLRNYKCYLNEKNTTEKNSNSLEENSFEEGEFSDKIKTINTGTDNRESL